MFERVHYYGTSDYPYSDNLVKAAERLRNNQISLDSPDVFDLIEMFNISRFFNDSGALNDEGKKFLDEIKPYGQKMKKALSLHFKGIDSKTMTLDFAAIKDADKAREYSSTDYFVPFDCYFDYEKSSEGISGLILENVPLYLILRSKKFSNRFSGAIKAFMLEHPENFELMVRQYDTSTERAKLWFPNFSNEEMNALIGAYLESESCDLNILELVRLHRGSKDSYCVSRENKVNIQNKIKQLGNPEKSKNYIFNEFPGIDYEFGVDKVQGEDFRPIFDERKIGFTLSQKSLTFEGDCDKAFRLLQNAACFVDGFGSVFPLFNAHKVDSFLQLFDNIQADQYGDQFYQVLNFGFTRCAFEFLYEIFKANGMLPEDLALWFLDNSINPFLKGNEISLRFASGDDYLIKCERLFNSIPMLLRKYRVYVENGKISKDLLFATKDDIRLGDYPSLIEGKYFELNEDSADVKNIMSALFTYRSQRDFLLQGAEESKPLFELVSEKKVRHSFCQGIVKNHIDFLIGKSILKENGGLIEFSNEETALIWKCFYDNLFIPSYLFDDKVVGQLNTYVEKQWCKKQSKLFSSKEADYLDFVLNNSRFSNALALRNLYEHGNGELFSDEENKSNYLVGLRTLFAVLYKIYLDLFHYRVINGKEKHQPKE